MSSYPSKADMSKPSAPSYPSYPSDDPPPYSPPYPAAAAPYPQPYSSPAGGWVPQQPIPQQAVPQQAVPQQVVAQQAPVVSVPAPVTIVTTAIPLGSKSTHMICPHCHAEINTATKTSPGLVAWLSSIFLCLVGCVWGCCLIPCCIDECMNVEHSCPKCKAFLGSRQ